MTDQPARPTSLSATIHNPAKPYVIDHRDGSPPEFLSIHVGGGASMFFDTKDQLTEWYSALGAEIGALLPDQRPVDDMAPTKDAQTVGPFVHDGTGPDVDPTTGDEAATEDGPCHACDARSVEQTAYDATMHELGQSAAEAADVIAAAGI